MDNYATKFVCETDQKYRWTPDMEYIATKVAELFAELLDERKENESIQ
jgi:hypothetical protein